MRQDQLKTLCKILLTQKELILNKTQNFRMETRVGNLVSGDEADLASTEISRNLDIRLIERERTLVHKIDKALEKISLGNYGSCEECGEPMAFSRLKARPVASLCIDCKIAQEQEEQIYA